MSDKQLERPIYINGVNGSTGEALLPTISSDVAEEKRVETWKDLISHITGEEGDLYKVAKKRIQRGEHDMGLGPDVDPKKLEQAGWGVVYAQNVSDAVKEALTPLIDWRRGLSNKEKELFKAYEFLPHYANPQRGFRDFMSDNDAAPRDDADPEEMPYYMLLVGDPQEIPYVFQYALDVNRAVGRIHFDTVAEYANYAESVVAAEKEGLYLPRQAAFFGVTNENDEATRLSTNHLIKPLYEKFEQKFSPEWQIDSYLGTEANKAQLQAVLGGSKQQTPAFLLTGSHGIGFDLGDNRQLAHQGALLCSDWVREPGFIPEELYMAGTHIDSTAQLHGLISFFFACYGAGTPQQDDFMGKVAGTAKKIAPRPFLAKLPQRMLSHPRGGALAVIGHVDRAWTYSFVENSSVMQTSRLAFESTLTELFQGVPVGHAFDYFNRKHASSSVGLVSLLDEQRRGEEIDDFELIDTWIMNHDARDYIIFGDPAVRLCVDTESDTLVESALTLAKIDLGQYQPGNRQNAVDSLNENLLNQPEVEQTENRESEESGKSMPVGPSGILTPREMIPGRRYYEDIVSSGRKIRVAKWKAKGSEELIIILADPQTGRLLNNINLVTGKPVDLSRNQSFGVTSAESMGIMDSELGESIQEALQKFSEQISKALHNISTLEVLTYLSEDDLKNIYDAENKVFREQAQLKAVTLLSLDGDIKSMVPARKIETISGGEISTSVEIDTDLFDIHKDLVALAQENQSRFFKNILEVAVTLAKMGS